MFTFICLLKISDSVQYSSGYFEDLHTRSRFQNLEKFNFLKVLICLNYYLSKFTFLPNYCTLTYRKLQRFPLVERVHSFTKFPCSYRLPINRFANPKFCKSSQAFLLFICSYFCKLLFCRALQKLSYFWKHWEYINFFYIYKFSDFLFYIKSFCDRSIWYSRNLKIFLEMLNLSQRISFKLFLKSLYICLRMGAGLVQSV
jgi:hypothetical protein